MADYDAFVLVSFGGPEGPANVIPFLENVTRGRGVPRERLAEVAHHYDHFGGVSPINQQCRDLLAAIEKDFAASGLSLPLYWGNRNWGPYLADTVAEMAAHGVRRAIAFVTSAYGSYSSCRQYLDDIENARAQVGPAAPRIDKIRHFFNHPGFIGPFTESTLAAIESLPPGARAGAPLVFTAHSVPEAMAAVSGPHGGLYPAQLAEAARLVAAGVAAAGGGERPWRLVYQSRSGSPSVPWLGPDVCDHLADLAAGGAPGAVMVPVGFVSDHLEVRYDLDVEAAQAGERLGLPLARAATPGSHPQFVSMITELVRERVGEEPARAALGGMAPGPDVCPEGCCRPRPAAPGPGRPGRSG
jgi:ferrochelatase